MICWFILWFTNQKTSVRTLTVSLHRPCWTNISDFLLLEDLIWLDIISLCFLFVGSQMRPRTFCPLAPRRPGSPGLPAAPGPPCRQSNRKEGLKIVTGFLYVSGCDHGVDHREVTDERWRSKSSSSGGAAVFFIYAQFCVCFSWNIWNMDSSETSSCK